MAEGQTLGAIVLVVSVIGIPLYGYLIFFWDALLVLEVAVFLEVVSVLCILAWIGHTLATTPPPQAIEEIEKELREEARKAEGAVVPTLNPPPTQR